MRSAHASCFAGTLLTRVFRRGNRTDNELFTNLLSSNIRFISTFKPSLTQYNDQTLIENAAASPDNYYYFNRSEENLNQLIAEGRSQLETHTLNVINKTKKPLIFGGKQRDEDTMNVIRNKSKAHRILGAATDALDQLASRHGQHSPLTIRGESIAFTDCQFSDNNKSSNRVILYWCLPLHLYSFFSEQQRNDVAAGTTKNNNDALERITLKIQNMLEKGPAGRHVQAGIASRLRSYYRLPKITYQPISFEEAMQLMMPDADNDDEL